MKNILIVVAVLVVVAAGGYLFMNRNNTPVDDAENNSTLTESVSPSPFISASPEISPVPSDSVSPSPANTGQVKEFTVVGTSFKFSPAQITVNKGDTVRIVFKNSGGVHDWVLDEFSARTKKIQSGETDTIEFVADKAGTFEYYCSVGTHRQMGMVGNLIVK